MDKKELILKAIDNGFYYEDKNEIHFASGAVYIGNIDAGSFVIPQRTENPPGYSYNLATSTLYRIDDYGKTWALTREELEVKSKVWKPEEGEKYWFIDELNASAKTEWRNNYYCYCIYAIGNCFKTKKDCEFAIERLKVIAELERFAEENNDEMDWNDDKQSKRYLFYDNYNRVVGIAGTYTWKHNDIYFSSNEIAQKAVETIGEERIKKYYLKVKE